jgi:voltage-gated potassium channel Kch
MKQQRRDSYVFEDDTSYSVSDHSSDDSIEKERDIHLLHDKMSHDNRVIRHHHFDNDTPKFDRNSFFPQTFSDNAGGSKYPTFVCPNCNMRQREFFTVSSAPRQYESEGTMLSLFFALYVVASLYIFGLQEGWGRLDCIYFAVITLTTAGLGDFVPTTDGAKIICSIFIYFGVACIGLLLGSYIAGMLDEKSYREAVANQIKACPNCARLKNMRYITQQRRAGFATANDKLSMEHIAEMHATSLRTNNYMEKASKKVRRTDDSPELFQSERISPSKLMKRDTDEHPTTPITPSSFESPTTQKQMLGSPMTTQILLRQSHTRHVSMDLRKNDVGSASRRYRHNSVDIHIPATVNEGMQSIYETKKSAARDEVDKENQNNNGHADPPLPPQASEISQQNPENVINDDYSIEDSDSDIDSLASEVEEFEGRNSGVRNAKYVILTLREALVNSLVILAFGCLGFYLIEGFTLVDSMYFTTVLLTSTGYGDIVPKSDGGKLFATVYLLVGGTILLNNMSMISMIPLELRKRRTEHSVLTQFGDSLDDDALRELATGPLIQRIHLGGKDSRGLDECTREMFALAMMIRLGKVTEHDIKLTFAAFRKLDLHNEGILNSKTIIGGMIKKRRRINLANRNNNQRSDHQTQHAGGSWINPPVPSSTNTGSFDPNSHGDNMNHSDHAPLLSMSDRGFPQYGMNQHPFVPTFNE